MALARAVRESVLRHARLAAPTAALAGAAGVAATTSAGGGFFARAFAAASTYLDKDQVTQRVLGVVKNFDKVDPAKVSRGWRWRGPDLSVFLTTLRMRMTAPPSFGEKRGRCCLLSLVLAGRTRRMRRSCDRGP
jgi:hypothetical protein